MIEVTAVDQYTARTVILETIGDIPDHQKVALSTMMMASSNCWLGSIDGRVVAAWGVAPPTMMSDQAYLWLHVTPDIIGNEFVFVRHSQRVVADLQRNWPTITGWADPKTENTTRWLKFLGAEFGEPQGKYIPFVIRSKHGRSSNACSN